MDEEPIVVLACGHFFTASTLDGLVGMSDVYVQGVEGDFTALIENSELASTIPRCPDCQCPIRQYVTQRYNRVINRAVIDEMTKRFLVSGQDDLRDIEQQVDDYQQDLEKTRAFLKKEIQGASQENLSGKSRTFKTLQRRSSKARKLEHCVATFRNKVAEKNQPAQKLHDATISIARHKSLDVGLASLNLNEASPPKLARDRRITLGVTNLRLKLDYFIISDKLSLAQAWSSSKAAGGFPGGQPDGSTKPFLKDCQAFITECTASNLPKLAVEASLYYANVARALQSYVLASRKESQTAAEHVDTAKVLLEQAKQLCAQPFTNAEALLAAVNETLKLFRKSWYEEVTEEEKAAIKQAMVSGSGGIATHSGHWYECENGHPFAIGECGMPMERARCPECGRPVGGQLHQAVEGVRRAEYME